MRAQEESLSRTLESLTSEAVQVDMWIAGRAKIAIVNTFAAYLAESICARSPIDSWSFLQDLEPEHYLYVNQQAVGFWKLQTTWHEHLLPIPAQNLQQTEAHIQVSCRTFFPDKCIRSAGLASKLCMTVYVSAISMLSEANGTSSNLRNSA